MTEPQINPPDPADEAGGIPGSDQPDGSSSPGSGSQYGQVPGQGRTTGSSAAGSAGASGAAGSGGKGAAQSQFGVATQERLVAGHSSVPAQREDFATSSMTAEPDDEEGAGRGGMTARMLKLGWVPVLLAGLGMIALGVMLLVWPHASLTVVAVLIGAAIVVSGLVRLWEGLTASDRSGGMRAAYVVIGLVAVLVGLYCLRHHALSLFIVTFLISVYFIAHGISDIGVAISTRVPGRGIRAVLGLFSLAAGIIILVWPAITLVLLLTIAAAWLMFYGLALGALAFSLWRAGRALTRESSSHRLETRTA
jgi:uncharacterized membrane protein HdeD (DUF308 family)